MIEKDIIKRCQKGDKDAFGDLYDAYIRKIYDFIYFKTFHKETAEDITSHVFSKAFENIGSINSDSSFSAWIYTIARNAVIDHYRKKKADVNIDDIWDLKDNNNDIESDIDNKNKLNEVRRYLSKIPKEKRDIVIMRIWGDMSYKEIADAFGKSEANCRMIFLRVVKKMREETAFYAAFLILWATNNL